MLYIIMSFLLKILSIVLIILTIIQYIKNSQSNFKMDNVLIKKFKLFDPLNKSILIIAIMSFILHLFISIR